MKARKCRNPLKSGWKYSKWENGIPDAFDSYGEPRFDDLDEDGNKAFIEHADECRLTINAVMTEEETAALALNAVMRTIY